MKVDDAAVTRATERGSWLFGPANRVFTAWSLVGSYVTFLLFLHRWMVTDLGLLSFVCRKTDVFMLLTQPAQAMDSNAPVQVAIGNAAPIVVRFQNLYASKAPLSRQIDWDAEIYFAEATPALVAALQHAERMQLDFGGRTYVVNLDNFARRWPIQSTPASRSQAPTTRRAVSQ